jgi:arylsulfatase A-like enzyme
MTHLRTLFMLLLLPLVPLIAQALPAPPNILLVVMDDVGVDQMASFGYGGAGIEGFAAPSMPSIDAIAGEGLRFRNTWSMPECSPGRAALFTGRYPLRNNILQAIGPNDLANSQLSPYEVTVARLLQNAGYASAMFGKFHLAGPENNEAGNGAPAQLGWEHFHGWTGGLPASLDTTAGGVAAPGTYSCGFVPDASAPGGSDIGACYMPPSGVGGCSVIVGNSIDGDSPGLQCLARGGILVPDATECESAPPAHLDFDLQNAHYVSPLVVNSGGNVREESLGSPAARGHRSTLEVDAAIDWIAQRAGNAQPWMATLSFSAVHTPLQPPPAALLPSGIGPSLGADCSDPLNQRRISDAMTEAMDTEFGRLLEETGIATRNADGSLAYDPVASNTLVVIVGDNGTFGSLAKLPFDPTRAKGTAYQTGVWVPLIVAGPTVAAPGRDVEHMVNVVDVFRLLGEVAGLDVPALVPRRIDSVGMMPYLQDPAAPSQRNLNFTQGGLNIQVDGGRNGPCVIGSSCSHIPVSKSVCEDNGGNWWGQGADPAKVLVGDLEQCWEVNQAIYQDDPGHYADNRLAMGWTRYHAVRNRAFKLVRNYALDYDPATDNGVDIESEELYRIDETAPLPLIDREGRDLLAREEGLNANQTRHYLALSAAIDRILDSQPACPGDGNSDGRVDAVDIANQRDIKRRWGKSSSYDFNYDGLTDAADRAIILANRGRCPR